jgi:hypothetical protein
MRERVISEFSEELGGIVESPHMPAGEMVLLAPEPRALRVREAEPIQPIQWESPSGGRLLFRIMGAMTQEIRSTAAGQCGVVHATGLAGGS